MKSVSCNLPSKHKTGGSSAARFGRGRDEAISAYVKKISEIMCGLFVSDGKFWNLGLILAGPSQLKDQIQSEKLFIQYFKNHLLKVLTVPEITEQSIYKVIHMAFGTSSVENDSDQINRFESMLSDPNTIDLFVFGTTEVFNDLSKGNLAEIFVDTNMTDSIDANSVTKTKINIVKNKEFINKYGNIIGIKYYASDLVDDNIIEI